MNAIHPSKKNADLPESATTNISATPTVYSRDLYYFVGKYQENYPSYGARILAQNIADLYRPNVGYAFATQALLAEMMNISTQQVRVLLKEVEASGYWEIQRGASARNEATRYRPVASELARAARWMASMFDSKISFTDPKVRAKSTKVSTRAPQGFTKDRPKKAASITVEPEYVFTEGVVPDWGKADPTETAREAERALSNEQMAPETTNEPEPQDDECAWEPTAVSASLPRVTEHRDPFAGPQSSEPIADTAWEPDDSDLDPFGNPFPTYTTQPATTHL